jgi:hypothetical protein
MPSQSSPPATCKCLCHAPNDGIWYSAGVSVLDVIEAAVACKCCRPRHCEALLSQRLANAPTPRVIGRWVDPEPTKQQADGDTEDGG